MGPLNLCIHVTRMRLLARRLALASALYMTCIMCM